MGSQHTRFLLRTLGFSALAGMRSLSPPAILSLYAARQQPPLEHGMVRQLGSAVIRTSLVALALGELLADKLPQAPNRTFAPALVFRALIGGAASALLWSLHKRTVWLGGLLGAISAIVATYATFNLRVWLGRTLPLRNALSWAGVMEDAVVWLGGWWLLASDEQRADES